MSFVNFTLLSIATVHRIQYLAIEKVCIAVSDLSLLSFYRANGDLYVMMFNESLIDNAHYARSHYLYFCQQQDLLR